MAFVKKRGNILHIYYYDPFSKKLSSKSTGLTDDKANRKKAEYMAKRLQYEMTLRKDNIQPSAQTASIREAFGHFLKNNADKKRQTIYEYNRFFKFFTEKFNEFDSCSVITKIAVEDWILDIKKLPYKKNTIHAIGKQCYHFLSFLFEYEYVPFFKINREVNTKPEVGEKIIFSDEDIIKIFDNLDTKNSNFQILVYMAFYTGLRSSDLMDISVEKIDLANMELRYYSPKRKEHREVPLHPDLASTLAKRIDEIKTGKLINYSSTENLGDAIERYFIKLGIKSKGYSARTFRKTFITRARAAGIDASIVRELVGHEHQNTADRYYNLIDMKLMKTELLKYKRPRAAE